MGELAVRLAVAIAVIAAHAVAARLDPPLVRRILDRRGPSYTRVCSGLPRVAVVLASFGTISVAARFVESHSHGDGQRWR